MKTFRSIKMQIDIFQCGHDPKVRVWDLTGDKTVSIELGDHKFAIDCVVNESRLTFDIDLDLIIDLQCFSPNVDRLVSIGSVHDGNIYVWSWKEKKKLASNKCTCSVSDSILGILPSLSSPVS